MKLYACIISTDAKKDKAALLSLAQRFSYSIELMADGIVFDVSGLQNLIGDVNKISDTILVELKKSSISGSIAIAETIDAAIFLARDVSTGSSNPKSACHIASPDNFSQLPLQHLLIDEDTQRVFRDLGIKSIRELGQIPHDELITRYGQQFKNVIDVI
ncbi:MAG: hypothetical protein H0U23_12960, partial [Blastocatellia bacterium]|nr:hypothetical protein [Blastocatellia bacterium]